MAETTDTPQTEAGPDTETQTAEGQSLAEHGPAADADGAEQLVERGDADERWKGNGTLVWSWQGRVGHPRHVGYEIDKILRRRKIRIRSHMFGDKPAVIRDVATFQARLKARRTARDFSRKQAWIGIGLILTVLPIIVGLWILRGAGRGPVLHVLVTYQGEEYGTRAKEPTFTPEETERVGVISDCRLDVRAWIKWSDWRWFRNDGVKRRLAAQAESVVADIQAMLPTLVVTRDTQSLR